MARALSSSSSECTGSLATVTAVLESSAEGAAHDRLKAKTAPSMTGIILIKATPVKWMFQNSTDKRQPAFSATHCFTFASPAKLR